MYDVVVLYRNDCMNEFENFISMLWGINGVRKNCNTDHAFTYIINLFCLDSDKLNLNQYRKKFNSSS